MARSSESAAAMAQEPASLLSREERNLFTRQHQRQQQSPPDSPLDEIGHPLPPSMSPSVSSLALNHQESRATPSEMLPEVPEANDSVSRFQRTSSPPPSTRKRLLHTHSSEELAATSMDDSRRSSIAERDRPERSQEQSSKTPLTSDNEDEDDARPYRSVPRTPIRRASDEISLLVNGRRFIVKPKMFEQHPDTMLGRMFGSGRHLIQPNENGDYIIDQEISPEAFAAVLDYYRHGRIKCPPTVAVSELRDACDFFQLEFSTARVQCEDVAKFLHELSNAGARRQFQSFLQRSLVPAMARCADLGERQCHIVVLAESDTVEWDEEMPPQLGEQYAKVVHDSSLFRFLYSYENRSIAKKLLKESGLKKIKLGIEGFPTFAERTRRNANGEKVEVEYHYDQRPFIKASWEKEDSKSRHVDFQYVRTPTTTNVLSTVMTS
eukprot:TRINITY_DN7694_c0_g1_i3.p1 TRINITY_DN7694_c0_g1~~TRINITY_DN7694_c0_g1_i3.p1  ORF type:complete len:437 (+),score=68.85 TRINITY_DN7694_c0_g1_i3:105-1415(+)